MIKSAGFLKNNLTMVDNHFVLEDKIYLHNYFYIIYKFFCLVVYSNLSEVLKLKTKVFKKLYCIFKNHKVVE